MEEGSDTSIPGSPDPRAAGSSAESVRKSWIGRGFIGKHWRGELSLPVSYWLINVLAAALMVLLAGAAYGVFVAVNSDERFSPTFGLLGLSIFWSATLGLYFWQAIGVWRSASLHVARGGLAFWAVAAKIMVVVGAVGTASQVGAYAVPQISVFMTIVTGDRQLSKRDIKILRDGTEIAYSGGITFGAAADLQKLLDSAPEVRVIHLNSPGGRILEAKNIGAIIRKRNLVTYTSERCASACTIAFMAGRQRWIARTARLGFHTYDFDKYLPPDAARAAFDYEKNALRALGLSQTFIERIFATKPNDMWYPSPEELKAAGVITGFAGQDSFAMSGLDLDLTLEKIDTLLKEIPLYRTISKIEPATYANVSREWYEGAANGDTEGDIIAKTRAQLMPLYRKYLPKAPDATLLDVVRLLIEEMEILKTAQNDVCFAFLFPDRIRIDRPVVSYFPPELVARDLKMFDDVLRAAEKPVTVAIQKAESERIVAAMIPGLIDKYGAAAVQAFTRSGDPNVDKGAVCVGAQGFYKEILALPRAQAVMVLRFVFGSI